MFDPTVFDNLKVVLEGIFYDMDREGLLLVAGREDLIDLASFSRTFRMTLQHPYGSCRAKIALSSELSDFAGELRGVRITNELPGAWLKLSLERSDLTEPDVEQFFKALQDIWGDTVSCRVERIAVFGADRTEEMAICRFDLSFKQKIHEGHMEDLEPLARHVLKSLEINT